MEIEEINEELCLEEKEADATAEGGEFLYYGGALIQVSLPSFLLG